MIIQVGKGIKAAPNDLYQTKMVLNTKLFKYDLGMV